MIVFGVLLILVQGTGSTVPLHAFPTLPLPVRILGISASYHDSALVLDGEIVAAAQEERFTRKKHDARFPVHAITYCLSEGGVRLRNVDYVVFYDKPFLKFERLLLPNWWASVN